MSIILIDIQIRSCTANYRSRVIDDWTKIWITCTHIITSRILHCNCRACCWNVIYRIRQYWIPCSKSDIWITWNNLYLILAGCYTIISWYWTSCTDSYGEIIQVHCINRNWELTITWFNGQLATSTSTTSIWNNCHYITCYGTFRTIIWLSIAVLSFKYTWWATCSKSDRRWLVIKCANPLQPDVTSWHVYYNSHCFRGDTIIGIC